MGREDIESELMFKALQVVNTRHTNEENLTMKGGDLKHTKSQLFLKTPQDRCIFRVILYLSPYYI